MGQPVAVGERVLVQQRGVRCNAHLCRPYGISQQTATSYETMLENSFDPSHSNYVHGSTFQKREDAMPMRAKLAKQVDPSSPPAPAKAFVDVGSADCIH